MRILFSMRHLGSFRLYESVLRRLAGDGHDVHVMANRRDALAPGLAAQRGPEALLAGVPNIRWSWSDDIRPNAWLELATAVRVWLDYLRYFEPAYAHAPRLRTRAAERLPRLLRHITHSPLGTSHAGRTVLAACLRAVERALPRQREMDALIAREAPDVVLLTPLLHLGSPQVEVLRSAQAAGVRTALCVGSWDHLSSKSVIRDFPDRVLVWNERQKQEAQELHGVPADRVTVTGAQCYDQWFGRTPARTREQFCAVAGLPADRPYLAWVCSALLVGSPPEAPFVRRWIEEMRTASDPALRDAAILVRPHPARLEEWRDVDLSDLPNVALYGALPIDDEAKEDYFETLYYSAAVVGLNTSAFLEAAIAGRPVHTIVLPEFRENQEGTIHFHYLLTEGGGLLRVARDFDEHRRQLAQTLRGAVRSTPEANGNAAFVAAFIRPHGLARAATDVFAEAVAELAPAPAPAPARTPAWALGLRPLLWPLALATRAAVARSGEDGDRTLVELQRARRKDQHRRGREADELRRKAARGAERQERTRQAEAARQAELAARRERIEASERQKREVKVQRERQKAQHQRAKRRAAIVSLIKRRIGAG